MKRTLSILILLLVIGCTTKVEEIKNPTNGKLLLRYEYKLDKDNQKIKHGNSIEWNKRGTKIKESNYDDGKLDGLYMVWNKDGILKKKVNYKDGKLHGKGTEWKDDGTLSKELNFAQGEIDGENKVYLNDSTVRISNFQSKKTNGPHRVEKIDGTIITEGQHKAGNPTGTWNYYDNKGELKFKLHFKDGVCQELIGKWRLKQDPGITYNFLDDGTYGLTKMAFGKAIPIRSGELQFSNKVRFKKGEILVFVDYGAISEYEIESINKNQIELSFLSPKGRKEITLERID